MESNSGQPPDPSIPQSTDPSILQFLIPSLLVLVMLGVALYNGVQAVRGVDWPDNWDPMRDMGIAQCMLDGQYPHDDILPGEISWYNPLVASILAVGSKVTGLPPHVIDVRIGPYANLLPAAAVFLLVACLFDPWAAVAALAFLLFSKPPLKPMWVAANYTPWLLSAGFTLALMSITLLLFRRGLEERKTKWWVAAGLALGATFMGHTAPALLAGGIMLAVTAAALGREKKDVALLRKTCLGFLVCMMAAFVCSLPYSGPILWRYHFHIVNEWPTMLVDPYLSLEQWPKRLKDLAGAAPLLAVAGIGALAASRTAMRGKSTGRNIVLAWLGLCLFAIAYSYARQALENYHWRLPQAVPVHHFSLFLSAVEAILAGLGVAGLCRLLVHGFSRFFPALPVRAARVTGNVLILAAAAGTAAAYYPSFRSAPEFTKTWNRAVYNQQYTAREAAYDWIRAHSGPNDVFLCKYELAVKIVEPAGRKVVATMIFYSNPYVDCQPGFHARDRMFEALKNRDAAMFQSFAQPYRMAYILAEGTDRALVEESGFPFITRLFSNEPFAVY